MKGIGAIVISALLTLSGCAGMDGQLQKNTAVNSLIWGTIGAGAGAAIAAVTKGNVARGAVMGGLAGAAAGAYNTPVPGSEYVVYEDNSPSYSDHYNQTYQEETERLRREEYHRWQQAERERARNDARENRYRRY